MELLCISLSKEAYCTIRLLILIAGLCCVALGIYAVSKIK
jgi:hypothetical protein